MSETLYCYGCGVALQSVDADQPGYVAHHVLGRSSILCQRCHTMKHFCPQNKVHVFQTDYQQIIRDMKPNSMVVVMLDAFHLRTTLMRELFEAIRVFPVVVLLNKVDVFPQSVKTEKLVEIVRETLNKWSIDVIEIIPLSVKGGEDVVPTFDHILDIRKGRNIYVMGAANVGKSSFINGILRTYSNDTVHQISTSPYPGTTLSYIEIPLDDETFLYDTPGVLPVGSYMVALECKLLKYLLPRKTLKPINYRFNQGQAIHIGGLARIDIQQGDVRWVGYFHPEVKCVRNSLEGVDQKFDNLIKHQQIFPSTETFHPLTRAASHHFEVHVDGKMDVLLSGLGWFTLVGQGDVTFDVKTPAGIAVYLRPALI